MPGWKWRLRWLLLLSTLMVALISAHAAPSQLIHTAVADFSPGDSDTGFSITHHQDGELSLTPRAQTIAPWVELTATPLPQALHDHALLAANGRLFVIGGESNQGPEPTVYTAAIQADGTLGPWQALPALPHSLLRHTAVVAGGGLLVLGGTPGRSPEQQQATVYRAAMAANGALSGWVELAATPLPQPLTFLSSAVVGGYLFVIGGQNSAGQRQATVYRAALNADGTLAAWTTTTALPIALSQHATATAGNCLFVIGGESDSGIMRSEVYSAAVGNNGELTTWHMLDNARLPQPLEGHTATAASGQLVVVGGNGGAPDYDRNAVYRATVHADCTLEPWQELTGATLPRQLMNHAAAVADGYLFVAGGHRYGNLDRYDQVYQARLIPDQDLSGWRALTQTPLPQPRSGHSAALSGDHLFVTGGVSTRGIESSVYRANAPNDGQTTPWTATSALPQPLHEHVTIAVGDRLLTIGGNNGSADQSAVYEATINADGSLSAWRSHPCALPMALSSHAAVLAGDYIYLSGGRQGFMEQDRVYRLRRDDDGTQGCWQPVTPLPRPLAEHAMAASDGYLFVSGGVTGAGANIIQTVYRAAITADGTLSAWTELSSTPLPTDLRSHVMLATNSSLYVIGGFQAFAVVAQYQLYRAQIKADGGLEMWQELATTPLPQALYNHAAIATDLHMLVLGGYGASQPHENIYITSLYHAVQQATFTGQFDLGSDQSIGVLTWRTRGDPDAALSVRFRIAPAANGTYGPWSDAATSAPVPIYERGRYLQYQLHITNPSGGVRAIDAVSLTYGDVGDYVKVIDEQGASVPGAEVYLNGQLVGVTNARGILLPELLPPLRKDDRLAVLRQVAQVGTVRAAHATPDSGGTNWAYRIYATNLALTRAGEVVPDTVIQSGGQIITIRRDRPLVLYNLLVSIEWDADAMYTHEITQAIRYASEYLYDLTDGQMAFGRIAIYDNAEHWSDADIQISTKNSVRPHAYVGGITSADPSHVIRVGRHWDGQAGNSGPWDDPNGYQTLGHEFGHYALSLYDEYFAYTFDTRGNLSGTRRAFCTGPENRSPATAATNASLMDYQYTSSELAMRGLPGLWSPLCEETAQAQLNRNTETGLGESDWETLIRIYRDTASPPRWRFTTPADRGSVLAGPTTLPPKTLPFPLVELHNSGPSGAPRSLTVYGPHGRYWGALVTLYTNQGGYPVAIDQGFTDGQGQLAIYGAQDGDTLRAVSFDGALSGSVSVTGAMTYTMIMAPPTGLHTLAVPGLNPYFILRPGSDGRSMYMHLYGLGPGGTLLATFTQSGGTDSETTALSYRAPLGAYVGAITFDAPQARQGTGTVQVVGVGGGTPGISLNSTYAWQAVPSARVADLFSADGNLQGHLLTDTLPVDAYGIIAQLSVVPTEPPEGLQIVGNAYAIELSGAQSVADRPFILTLRYDSKLLKGDFIGPATLRIYRWEPDPNPDDPADHARWVALDSARLEADNSVSIATDRFGIYALMGFRIAQSTYFPILAR